MFALNLGSVTLPTKLLDRQIRVRENPLSENEKRIASGFGFSLDSLGRLVCEATVMCMDQTQNGARCSTSGAEAGF